MRLRALPVALLVAAGVLAATSLARQPAPEPDIVTRALHAGYTDVGIPPLPVTRAFWQRRAQADPADYLSKVRLASTIMAEAKDTGDLALYPRAERIVRAALRLNPDGDDATLTLASARAANHDFATSRRLAQEVLDRTPSSTAARIAIADYNFELGNYPRARQQLTAAAAELGDGIGIQSRLAKDAAVQGRHDQAVQHAAKAVLTAADLDLRPAEAAFYRFQLAHFLYQAGRIRDALAAADAGLAIDQQNLATLELRAQILVALGRLPEAAKGYEHLLAKAPAADLHGALAKIYRALGRTSDAADQIAAGVKLGHTQLGRYPAERRHLAGFFADTEPATALRAARDDFATRKDIGAYDTLAWAYYRTGHHAEAERYVHGALAHGTRDATLLYHAGMIYAATGHHTRAAELLRTSLALNPRFDLDGAPRARTTLAELREPR